MLTQDAHPVTDVTVTAEEAPLGVKLWPTTDPDRNVLREVATVRDMTGRHVRWTYVNGHTEIYDAGERVVCKLDLSQLHV